MCDCGNKEIKIVPDRYLKQNKVKSCGCLRKESDLKQFKDITGQRFGKLVVIKRIGTRIFKNNDRSSLWECQCDCGKIINAPANSLGWTRNSCGCINHRKGENSSRYNHNLTQEDRIKRRWLPEFCEWRKKVYQRDNYTCQVSGQKSSSKTGGLCAHHLASWIDNKQLRFEISNGITLSREIHILFHKLYGQGYNTVSQFNEFKLRYDIGEFNSMLKFQQVKS